MKKIKSIWTTLSGSISSIIPLFFTVCKSGACGAICVSPIASLLGISSASLIASPLMQSLFPLLLVISSVSFTISYYKLYVLPQHVAACNSDCDCPAPTNKSKQYLIAAWTFWIGLLASIFFVSYFEYQTYKSNTALPAKPKATIENNQSVLTQPNSDTTETTKPCCSDGKKCE